MIGNKIKNKKNGTTLIELLIGIGLFSVVIVAFLQLFTSAFKEQSKVSSKVSLLNSASYVSEYMSRALRMAKKDLSGTCTGAAETNYFITTNSIIFLNYKGECQKFFRDGNFLKTSKNSSEQSLTPANLTVENLKFDLFGDIQDNSQPKVTFVLKMKNNEQTLNIQTTISQRNLNIAE